MKSNEHSTLYHRLTRLRWQAAVLAFALVLAHQFLEHTWLIHLPRWQHFLTQLFFYGLVGPLLAWLALTSLRRSVAETEQAEAALRQANERLEFLIRVNRRLVNAEDEDALIDRILALPLEVLPAAGCSLIRFDERQQPLPAVHRGELDPHDFEAWATHLAAGAAQAYCEHCSARWASAAAPCPILRETPARLNVRKAHCLPLACGGRQYGVLNIYLRDVARPTPQEQALLEAMATEMSLALESQQLRSRELAALYHLQQVQSQDDFQDQLREVLDRTVEALEADGGAFFLREAESGPLNLFAQVGEPLGPALEPVRGLAGGVQPAGAPLVVGGMQPAGNAEGHPHSLLIAPLHQVEGGRGSLVLWAGRANAFARRHSRVAAAVASQTALMLENRRLYRLAEYRAGLAERGRLAREIHDGLAQTLGYLKLRTAQILNWLAEDALDLARDGLADVRKHLDEAYRDAREAVDGLRLAPGAERGGAWLAKVADDFREMSPIELYAAPVPDLRLPPEVHAQLVRIVQEALGNIRKHSRASQASLEWQVDVHSVTLCVRDDGRGFDPDDVPPISRHGLRIMRERADLLDADFQIVSKPGAGTEVIVRLPLGEWMRETRRV